MTTPAADPTERLVCQPGDEFGDTAQIIPAGEAVPDLDAVDDEPAPLILRDAGDGRVSLPCDALCDLILAAGDAARKLESVFGDNARDGFIDHIPTRQLHDLLVRAIRNAGGHHLTLAERRAEDRRRSISGIQRPAA